MLSHGLAVEAEFVGYCRHTPPLLLQSAYVHKILQVEHWAPWSAQRFHTWGLFDRHYWGIFNRRFWGILDLALTDFISGRPFFHLSTPLPPPPSPRLASLRTFDKSNTLIKCPASCGPTRRPSSRPLPTPPASPSSRSSAMANFPPAPSRPVSASSRPTSPSTSPSCAAARSW